MRSQIAPRTAVIAANVADLANAQRAVSQARIAAIDAAVRPAEARVRRAPAENVLTPAVRASAVREATLIEPSITGKAFGIRLGSHRWLLPSGVDIAYGRGEHGDVCFVRSAGGRITILVDTAVGIKEMVEDLALVDEIRRTHFGR